MGMLKTIFVVDDSDTTLAMVEFALETHYRVITISSAGRMMELLEKIVPDLILLDIEMPNMNGLEALRRLKASVKYASIPVIFLSALNDASTEAYGIELGAVDFVGKPFSAPVLLNRIKLHLGMDEVIRERTARLFNLKSGIVSVMADLVESRDMVTGGHIERTTTYIKILLDVMLDMGLHADEIKGWDLDMVSSSARLHDVGKIAITDTILNKPGKLTPEEFESVKLHTREGERIIDQIVSRTGDEVFLYHAKIFAGYHHEKWNGLGYPHGTKGEETPLQGRIMAIADVYDALISERPYKKAFPPEKAESIIMGDAGTHFDPYIADAFYKVRDQFRDVGAMYG
jgi:putative two-component system response regulator